MICAYLSVGWLALNAETHTTEEQRKADYAKTMKLLGQVGISRADLPHTLQSKVDNWVATGNCSSQAPVGEGTKGKKREKKSEEDKQSKKPRVQPKQSAKRKKN